jgi:uncharacterized protein YhfF
VWEKASTSRGTVIPPARRTARPVAAANRYPDRRGVGYFDVMPIREDIAALPKAEFAFPGPLRDKLVAAILSGAKTTTTGLLAEYRLEGEQLPEPGDRAVVVDSQDQPVAVIETTQVRVVPLAHVDLDHAINEGEGDTTVAGWRASHESFWHSDQMREAMGDSQFTVDDTTEVVMERFRLVADLRH